MAVVIANSMVVGKLNAGKLRPKKPGDIDAPNQLTADQAQQIAEANNITPEQVSDLSAPELIEALSAANIPAPQLISSLVAKQIQGPAQINPQQAAQIQEARELDAISAASIAAPNQINAIPDNTSPPFDMRHARILYENKLIGSSVDRIDQSGSVIGISDAGNTITYNTYERFTTSTTLRRGVQFSLGAGVEIDTIAIGAHNLGSVQGDISIVYSNETSGGTFISLFSGTVGNDRPVMVLLQNSITPRRIRVSCEASSTWVIGNISAGVSLQMQRPIFGGHNPITMSRQTEYQSRRSESGNFLSRNIIRKGLSGSYEWSNLTDDWVREYFDPFIIAARKVPFYIAWRPESYPDEVAYTWTTGDISPSNIGTRNLMSVGMDVQAYGD